MANEYIYRIQGDNGRGPFKPGFTNRWLNREESELIMEFIAPGLHKTDKYKYTGTGCVSIEQLKKWFNKEEYKFLLKHGYKAVKIKADKITIKTENQCIFLRRKPLYKGCLVFKLYEEELNGTEM